MKDFEVREDIPLFESVVRRNVALAECVETGQDIFSYDEDINSDLPVEKRKHSNGTEDFYNLINELLYKIGVNEEFNSARETVETKSSNEEDAAPIKAIKSKKGDLKSDFQNFLNSK